MVWSMISSRLVPPLVHATHQFQTPYRKLVQTNVTVFFQTCQCLDVVRLVMLGHVKVLQNGSGSNDAIVQMFHSESLQGVCTEMFQ